MADSWLMEEPLIILELSLKEAAVLMEYLTYVSGVYEGPREILEGIEEALAGLPIDFPPGFDGYELRGELVVHKA